MKWDIDKALRALEDSTVPGTSVGRVVLSGVELMEREVGRLTAEEREKGYVLVWCLGLGKTYERKVFVYGRTIRAAHLRARKVVKTMTPDEREFYGVKGPKARARPR